MPTFNEQCRFEGGAVIPEGELSPPRTRSELKQEPLASYFIPWDSWRVYDALQTNLPGTPAGDDLGLVGGTFGTSSPSLQTADAKTLGAVNYYARGMIELPPEYDSGETVQFRLHAGMLTTVADVTATIDVEAFKIDEETGIGSDLVTTAATTINSLTLADKDFTLTASSLVPGSVLDIRIKIAINDAATATAVKGIIGSAKLLCDIRG